jgi:hypothetical protein
MISITVAIDNIENIEKTRVDLDELAHEAPNLADHLFMSAVHD